MNKYDESSTEYADYVFRAAESGETPWILLEPRGSDLAILKPQSAFLGLDLRSGTSYAKAKEIAAFLNENVQAVSCTTFKSIERSS